MYKDLNDETKMAYPWNNWATFKMNLENNWGEIDSPGTVITEIYKLHKQKKNISIPKYIQLFKKCIQKANINKDSAAIPFFTQGLQLDILEKCMMQNPTTLQGWYNAVMRVSNTKLHIGILSSLAHAGKGGSSRRDPDAMDVDAIMIQALSKEEREKHM